AAGAVSAGGAPVATAETAEGPPAAWRAACAGGAPIVPFEIRARPCAAASYAAGRTMSGGLIWMAIHTTHATTKSITPARKRQNHSPTWARACGWARAWVVSALMQWRCSVFLIPADDTTAPMRD